MESWGEPVMKLRESILRLKRFEADEKARKVADLQSMIREFEQMAADLDRQIATEESRTGVKDSNHFAYSTFAKAAAQRRDNLKTSVDDLKAKLDAAMGELGAARDSLVKAETGDGRDGVRSRRRSESASDARAG
jgi:flagellar export protein FliJ